jgi:hypothetical protein
MKLINFVVVDSSNTYVSIDMLYHNGINSTKIVILSCDCSYKYLLVITASTF